MSSVYITRTHARTHTIQQEHDLSSTPPRFPSLPSLLVPSSPPLPFPPSDLEVGTAKYPDVLPSEIFWKAMWDWCILGVFFTNLSTSVLPHWRTKHSPLDLIYRGFHPGLLKGTSVPRSPGMPLYARECISHDVLKIFPIYVCIVSWEDYCCLRLRLHHYCSEQVDDPWLCYRARRKCACPSTLSQCTANYYKFISQINVNSWLTWGKIQQISWGSWRWSLSSVPPDISRSCSSVGRDLTPLTTATHTTPAIVLLCTSFWYEQCSSAV